MRAFATLLDRLSLTPQRNGKLRLMRDYFSTTPDPDRGYALAAITRDLDLKTAKPATFRSLIYERMDPALFDLSYQYVGDLGEAVSLAWPKKHGANYQPSISEVVETLQTVSRTEASAVLADWLDALEPEGRWALIKMATGGLRVGVSSRLAKQALSLMGEVDVTEIEELWHGLDIPYKSLFAWLEGKGEKPETDKKAMFRPVMLAHALDEMRDFDALIPADFAAEWKWDGIRVQAVSERGVRRLLSRTGDDISDAFPDIIQSLEGDAAIDGELLVFRPGNDLFDPAPFSDLQKRLNRKTVSKKLLESHPAFIRAYDILSYESEDLRPHPFLQRREKLEVWKQSTGSQRVDLSPLLEFSTWDELRALRADPPHHAIEGVMLKRKAAAYVPGRPKGEWWKWKREPYIIDAVMMYAQRGHGKRSSFYSDYTFGVWRIGPNGPELTPVGKAYSGFTDEELKALDNFVRNNTVDRFGPVRQVRADEDNGLVLEVAFEGLNKSARHKSGVAMRFPRIKRIRWDKPAREADRLESLQALLAE